MMAARPKKQQVVILFLVGAVFVQWLGSTAIVPWLPVYVHSLGASYGLAGIIMASFFIGSIAGQFALGRLADRLHPRPLLVGACITYAVASILFVLVRTPMLFVLARGLQGVAAGGFDVVSAATIARITSGAMRGRAFALLMGAQGAGMAAGPMAGSLVIGVGLRALFVVVAALSVTAAGVVAFGLRPAALSASAVEKVRLGMPRVVLGAVAASIGTGLIVGVYETVWTLYFHSRGAVVWQIGLSWTSFSLGFILMSWPAGRMADRYDRRWLAFMGILGEALFAFVYASISGVWLILALSIFEGMAAALTEPALHSFLATSVAGEAVGRAEGVTLAAGAAAAGVGAILGGYLFGIGPNVPLYAAALLGVLPCLLLPVFWRGLPGRTAPSG